MTPSGRRFLGQLVTEDTTLKLQALPQHDAVTISFDLYEHVLRAHWPPQGMPRLIANHCTNSVQDYDETGVDIGPDCPGARMSVPELLRSDHPLTPAVSLPVPAP